MPRPHKVFTLNDEQRALIEDNIMLFYKCFHKLKDKYPSLSHDDIWDCCTEAVVAVAYNLDEKKGKFSTLLFIAAEKNVLKKIRYYDFECRKGSKTELSIDWRVQGDKSGSKTGEKSDVLSERYIGVNDGYDFLGIDEIEKLFDASMLNKREREVMYKIVIEDIARVDIAKEWGIRVQTVNKYFGTAKEKIRKVLEQ